MSGPQLQLRIGIYGTAQPASIMMRSMVQECGRFVRFVSHREGCNVDKVEQRQGNRLVGQKFPAMLNMAPLLRPPDRLRAVVPRVRRCASHAP
jgi:hypothetical protein